MVCFGPLPFLPVYLCADVGPWGLLAVALPAPFHNPPPCWVRQLLPCCESSLSHLPVSAPPTGLDECFFFISLVVRLLCGFDFLSVLVVFLSLNCCCPSFGCARRHSVSTYASILVLWNMFLKRLVKFNYRRSSVNLGGILTAPACLIFLFIFLLCGR